MIKPKLHAVIDYTVALILVSHVYIFESGEGHVDSWLAFWTGISIILYSLFSHYAGGWVKWIPWPFHRLLDILSGLLLLGATFLFHFEGQLNLLYRLAGIVLLLLGLLSGTRGYRHTRAHQRLDRQHGEQVDPY